MTAETAHAETHEFKAEIKKLLDIIIHSLYTNKEIFLRELISNSSDALDKARFELNRGTEMIDADQDLDIRIKVDQDNKVLTIADTGIGMNHDEIINNIGTIAKSGTAEFLKQVAENKENPDNIIGQFGVGFYSVFMVAQQVKIKSRSYRPEDSPVQWISDGQGGYEVSYLDEELKRGTSIEVTLTEDAQEFADQERIKSIIKKHSNFISFPIHVDEEKVNTISALWKEPKFNVTQEQYNEFYKFLTFDSQDPFETLHISVDAPVQFNSLIFIPPKDVDIFGMYNQEYGLDLYVRRVLIQKQNKDLIPEYLGFLKGVVDTEDLPLNISRESIQENALIKKINTTLTKQVLTRLEKIASEDQERYQTFWQEHGKLFKLGYSDFANRDRFAKLLRFNSSSSQDASGLTSLEDYVSRKKSDQKAIYYISGPSREAIESSPHLELFKNKGVEVLYLYEPVDEFVMDAVGTYQELPLTSVEQADLTELEKLPSTEEDKEKPEELSKEEQKELEQLLSKMQSILGDKVTEVRSSKRLSSSPACVVNPEGGMSSQMQKIMNMMHKDTSIPKKVLEINPNHELTKNLLKVYSQNSEDPFITTATEELFESALLLEGYLSDPHQLVNRTFNLLKDSSQWYTNYKGL
jgi:molecular chaperone HtpG